jgi:16S rRNA (guanine(966)-N(2))-methyltransferase RsmD
MNARVREALFNIISDSIEGSVVLDLFAGSGSLGLEALSRGANFCYFVENDLSAQKVLQRNIEKAGFMNHARLLPHNAFRILPMLTAQKLSIFFFDPPYRYIDDPVSRQECIQFLARLGIHTALEDALMVLHYRKDAMSGVAVSYPLIIYDRRSYGSTELMFLRVSLAK